MKLKISPLNLLTSFFLLALLAPVFGYVVLAGWAWWTLLGLSINLFFVDLLFRSRVKHLGRLWIMQLAFLALVAFLIVLIKILI